MHSYSYLRPYTSAVLMMMVADIWIERKEGDDVCESVWGTMAADVDGPTQHASQMSLPQSGGSATSQSMQVGAA